MRYALSAVLVALALAGCAGTPDEEDEIRSRRAEAQREMERECRIAAMQKRSDPRCPGDSARDPSGNEPVEVPPVPVVRMPLPGPGS